MPVPFWKVALGYQDESPAARTCLPCSHHGCKPALSLPLFSILLLSLPSSGSGQVLVGFSIMSGCLSCGEMPPLSPPTFFLLSLGSLCASQGPGPSPLLSIGFPIPGPRHQFPGPHKVNKPSATEEIKRGWGQLGLGKARKDKAYSLAGPQATGSREQGSPRHGHRHYLSGATCGFRGLD